MAWSQIESIHGCGKVEAAQSCLTLQPMDCSPPGCSVHGISQARIQEWVTISFSRGSSRPRDRTRVFLHCRLLASLLLSRQQVHGCGSEEKMQFTLKQGGFTVERSQKVPNLTFYHFLFCPTSLVCQSCSSLFLPQLFSLQPLGILFAQFPPYLDAWKAGEGLFISPFPILIRRF